MRSFKQIARYFLAFTFSFYILLAYTNCAESFDQGEINGASNNPSLNNLLESGGAATFAENTLNSFYKVYEQEDLSLEIKYNPKTAADNTFYNINVSVEWFDNYDQSISGAVKVGNSSKLDLAKLVGQDSGDYKVILTDQTSGYKKTIPFKIVVYKSPYLINLQHQRFQCTGLNGEVMTDVNGKEFCRFTTASCPAGWYKHGNWSTTVNATKSEVRQHVIWDHNLETNVCSNYSGNVTCTVTGHAWSDLAAESNSCYRGVQSTAYYKSICKNNVNVKATVSQIGCY